MNKLTFSSETPFKGSAIGDLQEAIHLLLDRGVLLTNDEAVRVELSALLTKERAGRTNGYATRKLVGVFQQERGLEVSGEVDEPTTEALNAALEGLGAFTPVASNQERVIEGHVRRKDGSRVSGLSIKAIHQSKENSIHLGEAITDLHGYYSIRYGHLKGIKHLSLRVSAYDTDGKLLHTFQPPHEGKPLERVDLTLPETEIRNHLVEGTVASRVSASVGGLRVALIDKGVGGDVQLAETVTDEHGAFQLTFSDREVRQRGKILPDVQVRVVSGETLLGASEVRYNASQHETLNVLLEDAARANLRSEHEVLTNDLAIHVKGRLGELKETDEQQDITFLANKTGWDARAVALAALADQFSAQTNDSAGHPTIPQPFFYALFRAGLPADEHKLYHTDVETLESVWKQAAEQGVIAHALLKQTTNVLLQFQAMSARKIMTAPPLIGTSSFKNILDVSGLNDAQQKRFAKLYVANRTDLPALRKAVIEDPMFGRSPGQRTQVINRLQVDTKIAFLTMNNAALMKEIHTAVGERGLSDLLQLAQLGYYRATAWVPLLTEEIPIPKEIPGETLATKRANYSRYLAAQVRLSYPTACVAQMVKNRELPLTGVADSVPDLVHEFLNKHQGTFEIGIEPIERYVSRSRLQVPVETLVQVKRLQRVYQITPSDEAMIGMMKRGIDAAHHVMRYDRDTFIRSFGISLGGEDQATLTYDRSVQIHNAVLNVAFSYLHARTVPAIGVHSPPSVIDPIPANTQDIRAVARLEDLFGSMEFCACDHCRSILSPAAYLVDLLQMLGSDDDAWDEYAKSWASPQGEHEGAPYPFHNRAAFVQAGSPSNTSLSPFVVLMSRRPDIQHLPLTCENTNTALPYIDVVNETLEYFVANHGQNDPLANYQGHDTRDLHTDDLLASPQFVVDAAYDVLRNDSFFPAPLPFDQPMENLRRYFNKFQVPLALALEQLRTTDSLDRQGNAYGWRDILMEEIGLSRVEHQLLTETPTAVLLWKLYGYPNGTADADVIEQLSNVKRFARRIDISYEDLTCILKARFINPHAHLIPKIERLGVSFGVMKKLKDDDGTGNQQHTDSWFDSLLASQDTPPDPAAYGGDIKAWVKDGDNYSSIMSLITLAVPASNWVASKAYILGDCVTPTTTSAESTLYYQCTTAGTAAGQEPSWPTVSGNTSLDGTVVWTCVELASCRSFENLGFRYSDPAKRITNIGSIEFIRLLRFVRLWKKLGWSINQTDAAICALYRSDLAPLEASDIDQIGKLNSGFLTLLPRLGVVSRALEALGLNVKRDLLALLACFAPIGTHDGAQWVRNNEGGVQQQIVPSLYRQMFLSQTIIQQDPVFRENGYGEFFEDASKKIEQHAETLRSALSLTGDEYDQIVSDLGFHAQTSLSISNISAIFRRGWLARKLKISVRELLVLVRYSGLDPFALPDLTDPAILRLIRLIQALKNSSLKSSVLLYVMWNQDLSGKSAPDPAHIAELARSLRNDFAAIDEQFAAVEDPNGDVARARMTLVYGQETADQFFALLDDTLVVDVSYTHSAQALENAILAAYPRIMYDAFRHRLTHRGLLTAAMQSALNSLRGVSPDFTEAVKALHARSEDIKGSFLARNPELKPIYDNVLALEQTLIVKVDYVHGSATLEPEINAVDNRIRYDNVNHRISYSGLLTTARRDVLKAVPKVTSELQSAIDALFALSQRLRGEVLLAQLQPGLSFRRKRQQAIQRLNSAAGGTVEFTQTLLDPLAKPYPLHAASDHNKPVLDDVLALETSGLAAEWFYRDTATGNSDGKIAAVANLDYASGGANPLPNPGNQISGIWSGEIEIPEAGYYNFVIEGDSQATITLTLDGQVCTLTKNGSVRRNVDPIELQAGTLHVIELKVEKVKDKLSLKWETPKRPRELIPARYLYPPTIIKPFTIAYVRLLKAMSLATGLGITANELAFFATHPDYQVSGDDWLNALTVTGDPQITTATSLLGPIEALLGFARIKVDISADDELLLTALRAPVLATQDADSLLFQITRWARASVNEVLSHFGSTINALGHFDLFLRVYDAVMLAQQMGISAKALIQAATNEPTTATVRDLQSALRARYDAASWRDVVRPINDEMRSLQRDALVAYILHKMQSNSESAHIDTSEKLFEYFLMDVQMDPCMLTSRIRHVLSSVQLFIERCLMNLEPRVSPAAISPKKWEWMKRYRTWEANRKVYLFPENWLEPELRDNQSPFFKEAMSEMLQGDITEERAASAMLNYLSKLEEVAKLEPCGIHYVEGKENAGEDIAHVVARTAGANRKYYYRRREYGTWTPWEQIKADIEDNPVIPVMWNGRMFLFWLRIIKQVPMVAQKFGTSSQRLTELTTDDIKTETTITIQAILCWSEYYDGKWQPTKTSDINLPTSLGNILSDAFDRSFLQLVPSKESDGSLRIRIYGGPRPSSFLLYNTHSLPLRQEDLPPPPHVPAPDRYFDLQTPFKIYYDSDLGLDPPKMGFVRPVLSNPMQDVMHEAVVEPQHPLLRLWEAPFFYEDSRYVFYVTTTHRAEKFRERNHFTVLDSPEAQPLAVAKVRTVDEFVPRPAGPTLRPLKIGGTDTHRRIDSLRPVMFNNKKIGPAGSELK